jgi:hypothetical protein
MKTQTREATISATIVNRIPPSSTKPTKRETSSGSKACSPNAKRNKHSFKNARPMGLEPLFQKLNPSDPKVAHRIEQRRKAISKGRATAGYENYVKQIKREERRDRCLEFPSTPDATADMSNNRFFGLVRAW